MNPVNATSLYVSASRSVLQCDPRDPRALAELCKLLPFFRQSLSCLVCGDLLQDPIAPTDSACQHYVCRGCRGRRMRLKPSCSWCKDYSRFQENRQLSLLVRCYRKLCLYIARSPLAAHIAGAAGDSPELRAILDEGLTLAEGEPEAEEAGADSARCAPQPTPVADAVYAGEEPKKAEEPSPAGVNGLHGDAGGGVARQEGFSEEAPVCASVAGEAREAGLCDITSFGEDLRPGGGPLRLSVEEVLRTLETDPDPDPDPQPNGPHCLPDSSHLLPSLSPCPLQPPPQPSAVLPQAPPRFHRKRSRSESDGEKLRRPLPIAALLRGPPPLGANGSSAHHPNLGAAVKQEFPLAPPPHPPPHSHLAPVPNGGPPKVGKTVLVSNKALKKTAEHHGGPKKAYAKARQGTPKPRTQPRDRLPPHPHPHPHPLTHPPSPSKPLYKKPVEKKGCKCGRATQNPSVLTCRGQRCPCYSNRKACLDCICRGCQNSYMANGEKKLEAFAVPEKALEQTRLTLGINLTSIAAAALRGPAASSTLLNVTTATGAPVTAAFLSGAGRDGRGFDESLEMRFDC